jgi:hypothetical protein
MKEKLLASGAMLGVLAVAVIGCGSDGAGGDGPDAGGAEGGDTSQDGGDTSPDGGDTSYDAGETSLSCEFSACGGDPVGLWTFEASCADLVMPGCPTATFVSDLSPTGTLEFRDDMTYEVNLVTQGTFTMTVPSACLALMAVEDCSELEDEEMTCTGEVSDACVCVATFDEVAEETGTWSVSGGTLTLDEDDAELCVSQDVLKIRIGDEEFSGTMVLSR